MGTFMTRIPRCVYLGIGVIMGSVIKSAKNNILNYMCVWLDTFCVSKLLVHTQPGG